MRDLLEMPSKDDLWAVLHYDEPTGELTWKRRPCDARWNAKYAGCLAFTADNGLGYRVGAICGTKYFAHRIIWKMMTGQEPHHIDHINGDTKDNRFANLRSVIAAVNHQNRATSRANTSGRAGVHFHKRHKKWAARITVRRKERHLGYFDSFEQAVKARECAEQEIGFTQRA